MEFVKAALTTGLLLVALLTVATPTSAEPGPCAGTPENNCRPFCETGDIRDCVAWPVLPCLYVEDGHVICLGP